MSDPNRAAEKAAKLSAKKAAHDAAVAGLEFQAWPKIGRLNRDIVITEKIDGTNAAIGVVPIVNEVAGPGGGSESVPTGLFRVYAQSRSRIISVHDDNMGFAAWVEKHAAILAATLGEGLHFGEWWGVGIQRGYGLSERRFSLFNTERWNKPEEMLALAAAREQGVSIFTVPVLYTGPWTGFVGYKDTDTDEWLDPIKEEDWPALKDLSDQREQKIAGVRERLGNAVDSTAHDLIAGEIRHLLSINPRARFTPHFILEWLVRRGSFAAPGFKNPEGIVIFHKASGSCFKATCEKDEQHKGEK